MHSRSPEVGNREGKRQQTAQCMRELSDSMFQVANELAMEIPGLSGIEKKRTGLLLLRSLLSASLFRCFALKLSSTTSEDR